MAIVRSDVLVTSNRPATNAASSTTTAPALATTNGIEARVDGQSVEPGLELLGITQPGEVSPSPDVCLLDCVPREVVVPEDKAGDGLQLRDGAADKRRESVMIASTGSFDELPLVHSRPRWRGHSAAFKGNGARKRRSCL